MAALGKLVVNLSANIAEFSSAMDKAAYLAKSRMDAIARVAKVAAAAVAAALVAAAASVANEIRKLITSADEISKTAERLGVTTEALQRLRYAAELSGVASEDLTSAMAKLARQATEGNDAFAAMGVNVRDANGNLKSADTLLAEVADRFASYRDGAEKTSLAMELFGKSGYQMISMLNAGSAGLKESGDEAKEFGAVLSDNAIGASVEFKDNLTRIQTALGGMVTRLAEDVIPLLRDFSNEMVRIVKESDGLRFVGRVLLTIFQTLVVLGAEVAFVFKMIGWEIGGIAAQAQALLKLDFKSFRFIGDKMLSDAQQARAELDAFTQRIMTLGEAVKEARDKANGGGGGANKPAAPDLGAMQAARKKAEEEKKRLERLAEETRRAMDRMLGEGESVRLANRSPFEVLNEEIERLETLLRMGAVSWETYGRASDAAQDSLAKSIENARKQQEQLELQRERAREALYSGLLSEEEQIRQSYERKRYEILTATEITELERQDLMTRLQDKFDKDQLERQQRLTTAMLGAGEKLFGGLAGFAKALGGESSKAYRVLFATSKAFAIADATIKLQQAIANAAASAPFPANLAAMSSVAAAVSGIIGTISSTGFSGAYDKGGMIPGGRWGIVGEYGPEIVQGPAMVTSRADTAAALSKPTSIRIVNAFDVSVIGDYLGSDAGEEVIMNAVRRNQGALRGLVAA
jgi:hypothetical protein